jgi:ribosomal protein S1
MKKLIRITVPPQLFSIHSSTVRRIESYGVFVEMDGFSRHGLVCFHHVIFFLFAHTSLLKVHISQLSSHRVENPEDVVAVGERLHCKVIQIKENDKGIPLVSLSVKYVDQGSGLFFSLLFMIEGRK